MNSTVISYRVKNGFNIFCISLRSGYDVVSHFNASSSALNPSILVKAISNFEFKLCAFFKYRFISFRSPYPWNLSTCFLYDSISSINFSRLYLRLISNSSRFVCAIRRLSANTSFIRVCHSNT
ncbi:unnamed protein product [Schistosoma mattheei]|uniref:Uncharacterized protein n=1 Tax=Schistosoma mattheei TaxID=31246 RepID=A0A3P8GTT3_9TREM|nr:unnamed protein product [Schistosoma mattheei]